MPTSQPMARSPIVIKCPLMDHTFVEIPEDIEIPIPRGHFQAPFEDSLRALGGAAC